MSEGENVWSAPAASDGAAGPGIPTGTPAAAAGQVPAGWVRVQGTVLRLNGLGVGGWTISYPLPDGSAGQLRVANTRPQVLREQMSVPVLVNVADPRQARLDFAPHTRVRNTVLIGVAVVFGVVLVVLALMAVLFAALAQL